MKIFLVVLDNKSIKTFQITLQIQTEQVRY